MIYIKKYIAGFALLALAPLLSAKVITSVKSPDGKLEGIVEDGIRLSLSIKADGETVLDKIEIGMSTNKGDLGKNAKFVKVSASQHSGEIKTVYGIRDIVKDEYSQVEIEFENFVLFVRAYNEALAYRFATKFDGEIIVKNEIMSLPLSDSDDVIAHVVKGMFTSGEEFHLRLKSEDLKKHANATLPFLMRKNGFTVALVDSDVSDYPAMRIDYPEGASSPKAAFAKVPSEFKQKSNFIRIASATCDYIAKTSGNREFPWRAFIVARQDSDLADNDTVFKLAAPSKIKDTSWISYGACTWEWWNDWGLEGVGGFKSGVNYETYKYFIDFASENKIPFLLIDAGWLTGVDVGEMTSDINEDLIRGKTVIDVKSLIEYAHSKNVKVLLWVLGQSMDKYAEEAFKIFKKWNVDGLKIDFIDRDDQQAMAFYERIARLAAENKMTIDWHGCAKPAGLQRTYPNVVNFEAVRGCEYNKFNKDGIPPSHNVDLVFTRMLQGPMDYTPGAMNNATKKSFVKNNSQPKMMGTRSHMAAMYVLFYAPLQMLCDSPTEYQKYPDVLSFISDIPTSWDDTVALDGEIGKYLTLARRKNNNWYVGGMCDWDGKDVEIDFSKFLPAGKNFNAEIMRDVENSSRIPRDYVCETMKVNSSTKLKISMKEGGGFAIKLTPRKFLGLF